MNYMLDTNICIYIIKKQPVVVLRQVQSKQAGEIALSTITLAELEYGVSRSHSPDRNRAALLEFALSFTILDFDQRAAAEYGRIRLLLESKGRPIGPMDLLLAAQAKSRNLILVTNNEKEFRRIEGLRVENWARVPAR
ncbi:MAG: type II toxin-antitoxin system VapC family toxin [Planctomycetes bacterium]|nr:type II toxin-antitoxin system VapC family toxin [Planctomycetota bacterium]